MNPLEKQKIQLVPAAQIAASLSLRSQPYMPFGGESYVNHERSHGQ